MSALATQLVGSDADLCRLARSGDRQARNVLLERHYRLCCLIAHEYAKRTPGVEADDLAQEAVFAMMDAVRWFDAAKNFRFTTYAGACIHKRLVKLLCTPRLKAWCLGGDDEEQQKLLDEIPCPEDAATDAPPLHPLVSAVLSMRAEGMGEKQAAKELGTTVSSVRKLLGGRRR